MLIEFFKNQTDYILFFYGLIFILLSIVCFVLTQERRRYLPWAYLGIFSFLQGAHKWMELIKFDFGDTPVFYTARLCVFIMSLPAAIFSAWVLLRASKMQKTGSKSLFLTGLFITLFVSSNLVNYESFMRAFKFPVQLLQALLALSIFFAVWEYLQGYYRSLFKVKENRLQILYRIFLIILLLTAIIGGWVITDRVGKSADYQMRSNLLLRTKLVAASVDINSIKGLSGTINDLQNQDYQRLKKQLRLMCLSNSDIRFIYLMGAHGSKIFFFLDSELETSENYSPPGQEYPEATAALINSFSDRKPFIEGPTKDRWGTWVSGLVPIYDESREKIIAVLGMDINARNWYKDIAAHRLTPIIAMVTLFISILLIVFLIVIQLAYLFIRRITASEQELRQAYTKLEATQAQLIQSEKMASLGQLAAGVAHEINNPAAFVMSNLNTLKEYKDKLEAFLKEIPKGYIAENKAKEMEGLKARLGIDQISADLSPLVSETLDGAQRIKKIVQGLMIFSQPSKEEMNYADINECIDGVLHLLANELKYKVEVIKEYGEVPGFLFNFQQISQVFVNILVNAVQSVKEKGRITIKTYTKDGFACIEISDTGSGIPEDILPKIFDPFFTTKDKGTGLGLSIVYGIIQKHNGKITVSSKSGEGTTFVIRLPLKKNSG